MIWICCAIEIHRKQIAIWRSVNDWRTDRFDWSWIRRHDSTMEMSFYEMSSEWHFQEVIVWVTFRPHYTLADDALFRVWWALGSLLLLGGSASSSSVTTAIDEKTFAITFCHRIFWLQHRSAITLSTIRHSTDLELERHSLLNTTALIQTCFLAFLAKLKLGFPCPTSVFLLP